MPNPYQMQIHWVKANSGYQSTRAEGSQNYITSSEVWKCAEEEALKRTLAALCFIQNILCIFLL